jgi:hypothetical protein
VATHSRRRPDARWARPRHRPVICRLFRCSHSHILPTAPLREHWYLKQLVVKFIFMVIFIFTFRFRFMFMFIPEACGMHGACKGCSVRRQASLEAEAHVSHMRIPGPWMGGTSVFSKTAFSVLKTLQSPGEQT